MIPKYNYRLLRASIVKAKVITERISRKRNYFLSHAISYMFVYLIYVIFTTGI